MVKPLVPKLMVKLLPKKVKLQPKKVKLQPKKFLQPLRQQEKQKKLLQRLLKLPLLQLRKVILQGELH